MKTLVTGANGFIGSTLCKALLDRGDTVRGLVRTTSDLTLLEDVPIERVTGSLGDAASLREATREIDVVYHVAAAVTDWGTLDYFRRINVEGTENLIEAAVENGVSRFVYVSSVAVHSFTGAQDMTENSPQLPTPFPYCQTKRDAEALVMTYHAQGKIPVAIVRPGDMYGPGDRVALLKMSGLIESGWMSLIGKGDTLGAFTYVDNLCHGLILAGTKDEAIGEAFVITDGVKLSWRDYFTRLTAAIGAAPPRIFVPPALAGAAAALLEAVYRLLGIKQRPPVTRYLVHHLRADFHFSIEKARRLLGYEPPVSLDEAINRTAAWYRSVVRGE